MPDPHHPLTHHRGHPDFIEKVTKINCFHAQLFAYFVAKLKAMPEGDGVGAGPFGDPVRRRAERWQRAFERELPLLVAGQTGTQRIGGRHLKLDKATPAANLFLTMLDGAGMNVESFADSTGPLDLRA